MYFAVKIIAMLEKKEKKREREITIHVFYTGYKACDRKRRCHKVSYTLASFGFRPRCRHGIFTDENRWENLRGQPPREKRERARALPRPVEAASTSVRLDDIGASHPRDPVLYTRARPFIFVSLFLCLSTRPTGIGYTTRVTCPSREPVKWLLRRALILDPVSAGGPARRADLSAQRGVSFDFAWHRSAPARNVNFIRCALVFLSLSPSLSFSLSRGISGL